MAARKYDGSPHWRFEGVVYLGADAYGDWVGGRPGDRASRPGREFTTTAHYVTLLPRDAWFAATFNDAGANQRSQVYIDVTSVPEWEGARVSFVDLDLDVVRRFTGEMLIDDEDEFADHRVRLAYPPEVVASARRTADALLADLLAGREPYATVGFSWLERMKSLG